jgi:hypothetical protein
MLRIQVFASCKYPKPWGGKLKEQLAKFIYPGWPMLVELEPNEQKKGGTNGDLLVPGGQ